MKNNRIRGYLALDKRQCLVNRTVSQWVSLISSGVLFLATTIIPSQASNELLDSWSVAQQPSNCSEAELESLIGRWRQSDFAARSQLRDCSSLAVPGLTEVIADETADLRIRQLSARLLAQTGSDEAVIALLDATQYELLETSIYESFKVLDPNTVSAIPLLLTALNTSDLTKATAAAIGLAQVNSEAALEGLLLALGNEQVQEAVFIGLEQIDDSSSIAVDVLGAALENEMEIVQIGAAYGLAEIGSNAEAAIPKLIDLLLIKFTEEGLLDEASEEVRGMAAYALGKINPLHEDALIALCLTTFLKKKGFYPYYGVEILPEQSENVKRIAFEAFDHVFDQALDQTHDHVLDQRHGQTRDHGFDEISDIDRLVDFFLQVDTTSGIVLNHQSSPEALLIFDEIFLANSKNKELKLTIIRFIDYYFKYTYLAKREIIVNDTFASKLVQIANDEEEDQEIRYHSTNILRTLYSYSLSESEYLEMSLIEVFENSYLYSVWDEDFDFSLHQYLDWDTGFVALQALIYENSHNSCAESSSEEPCIGVQNSIVNDFLDQLEMENGTLFDYVRQSADSPSADIGIPTPRSALSIAASISNYNSNNLSSICRFRIAQMRIPRCR